jgi:hypothetical protein
MIRSVKRGTMLTTCLVLLAGVVMPLSSVTAQQQPQQGVNVGLSVAPVLFTKCTDSHVTLCFSSLEQTMQTLEDRDTFTFSIPTAIGYVCYVQEEISVDAVTLRPCNFTACFVSTPAQRVIVTYHQTGPTQVLNYGDTLCVNVGFNTSYRQGSAKISLQTRFNNKLTNGALPFVTASVTR